MSMIIFLNVRSAAQHVWSTGLSQNVGGRPNEISSYGVIIFSNLPIYKGSCLARHVTQEN